MFNKDKRQKIKDKRKKIKVKLGTELRAQGMGQIRLRFMLRIIIY